MDPVTPFSQTPPPERSRDPEIWDALKQAGSDLAPLMADLGGVARAELALNQVVFKRTLVLAAAAGVLAPIVAALLHAALAAGLAIWVGLGWPAALLLVAALDALVLLLIVRRLGRMQAHRGFAQTREAAKTVASAIAATR